MEKVSSGEVSSFDYNLHVIDNVRYIPNMMKDCFPKAYAAYLKSDPDKPFSIKSEIDDLSVLFADDCGDSLLIKAKGGHPVIRKVRKAKDGMNILADGDKLRGTYVNIQTRDYILKLIKSTIMDAPHAMKKPLDNRGMLANITEETDHSYNTLRKYNAVATFKEDVSIIFIDDINNRFHVKSRFQGRKEK